MQDLSTLSNDELFKLCKSSGISAGPITQTTRSVYEKKLLRYLNEVTDSPKPVETPVESPSPVVILKANLQAASESSNNVEALKFAKPLTPKPKPQQQQPEPEIVYVEKPSRRSVAKLSSEERIFEITQDKRDIQPTIIQTATRTYREEILNDIPERNSPIRQKRTESPKKVVMPEFRLLKPQQSQPQEEVRVEPKASFAGPNIRKRTATVERPSVLLSDKSNMQAEESKAVENKSSGFFSLKKLLLVLGLTVVVYFLMIHLQSNPENPIEV